MKMGFRCGICKHSHSTPRKAEMCCWKEKREIGHFPNVSKKELEKMVSRKNVMVLKKPKNR